MFPLGDFFADFERLAVLTKKSPYNKRTMDPAFCLFYLLSVCRTSNLRVFNNVSATDSVPGHRHSKRLFGLILFLLDYCMTMSSYSVYVGSPEKLSSWLTRVKV